MWKLQYKDPRGEWVDSSRGLLKTRKRAREEKPGIAAQAGMKYRVVKAEVPES